MARLLVQVVKTRAFEVIWQGADIRIRHPRLFNPREIRDEGDFTTGEFWEVEEEDKAGFVAAATLKNPGVEVKVWSLIEEAVRPAGELVVKKVSKDGVLPA